MRARVDGATGIGMDGRDPSSPAVRGDRPRRRPAGRGRSAGYIKGGPQGFGDRGHRAQMGHELGASTGVVGRRHLRLMADGVRVVAMDQELH